ncbi:MAG: hypothetical protein JNM51_03650 [Bacteroidia bacterium]|nr:hypothetical protein [Bacteroidia bacterium]
MQDERKAIKEPQTRVELQVLPCASKAAQEFKNCAEKNHESQDDPCGGKIILSVTCDGSKLTKADAGRLEEFTEEIFVSAKIASAEFGKMPGIDVNVTEKCGAKLTKADAGKI